MKIALTRKLKGITQAQLAAACETTQQQSALESRTRAQGSEKTEPKVLKLLDSRILKRQKILEQPNRKKQLSMLMTILKEELVLELKA
jgi:transcriptional regulator with XRE-family HTH domain